MSRDQKVMMLLLPKEKCPINVYQGVAFIAQFHNSSPSVTRDKEIVTWLGANDITTS